MKTKSRSVGLRYVTLDRHPKVLEYDNEGTDEGRFIITLVRGYAFDDPAENEGDDPDASMACHSRGVSSVTEALRDIKWAQPCKCGRCLGHR